jgi:glutamine synthetase
MARPAIPGFYSSGWHLHQSLVDGDGRNLFMPSHDGEALSPEGRAWLGGLLRHAVPATAFATPTVNGYRRFRPNSLAPDRVAWGIDHRGTLLRVLGAAGDPASRIENRGGEPSANPYLYIASQIVAGLDGIDGARDPGPPDTDPYMTEHVKLPASLIDALDLLEREPLFSDRLGQMFMSYYLQLKRTEAGRYVSFCKMKGIDMPGDEPTEWEQNEYFDFF